MARAKSKAKAAAARRSEPKLVQLGAEDEASREGSSAKSWNDTFSKVACVVAHWMGKPVSFLIATSLVVVWALSGPMFHFSDTWQLVINTSTTIVTFLMVFLIQNTQNRDTMALQLKLSELILCLNEAENRFAGAEDLTEDQLELLQQELRERADTTRDVLDERRASRTKKES